MTDKPLYIKPAVAGAIIRDPVTLRPLLPEGDEKPRTVHWLRMLGRADVVETTPEAIAKGKAERLAAETAAEAEPASAKRKTAKE